MVVHNDSVCCSVEQGGLCKQLSLLIFADFLMGLSDIMGSQCVQGAHLIFFKVFIVKVSISARCLQDLDKVRNMSLLVVFELERIEKIHYPPKLEVYTCYISKNFKSMFK